MVIFSGPLINDGVLFPFPDPPSFTGQPLPLTSTAIITYGKILLARLRPTLISPGCGPLNASVVVSSLRTSLIPGPSLSPHERYDHEEGVWVLPQSVL